MDLWPLFFSLLIAFFIVVIWNLVRRPESESGHNKSSDDQPVGGEQDEDSLIFEIVGPGLYEVDIVGESFYQDALNEIAGGKTEDGHSLEKKAILFLQDDNPHDDKAVAIFIDRKLVGHLERETARSFRQELATAGVPGQHTFVGALIVGGWSRENDEGHYGVKLDLPVDDPENGAPNPEARAAAEEERNLFAYIEETEADAARNGWGVAPGWYERLAILYRKQKRYDDEVEILERYEAQPKAPGALPKKLAERLIKARAIRVRNRAR